MPSANISHQIACLIGEVEDITKAYGKIKNLHGLPKAFEEFSKCLPLAEKTLQAAKSPAQQANDVDDANRLESLLKDCQQKAEKLLEIFKTIGKESSERFVPAVYQSTAVKLGKDSAEKLMGGILNGLEGLAAHHVFEGSLQEQVESLKKAQEELSMAPPSLSDPDLDKQPGTANQIGNDNRMFNCFGGSQKNIEGGNYETAGNIYIGRACPK